VLAEHGGDAVMRALIWNMLCAHGAAASRAGSAIAPGGIIALSCGVMHMRGAANIIAWQPSTLLDSNWA